LTAKRFVARRCPARAAEQTPEDDARLYEGEIAVLIATDVASRVCTPRREPCLQFDLPNDAEDYTCIASGRTARAGAEGDAISFGSRNTRSRCRYRAIIGHQIPRRHRYRRSGRRDAPPPPCGGERAPRPGQSRGGGRPGGGGRSGGPGRSGNAEPYRRGVPLAAARWRGRRFQRRQWVAVVAAEVAVEAVAAVAAGVGGGRSGNVAGAASGAYARECRSTRRHGEIAVGAGGPAGGTPNPAPRDLRPRTPSPVRTDRRPDPPRCRGWYFAPVARNLAPHGAQPPIPNPCAVRRRAGCHRQKGALHGEGLRGLQARQKPHFLRWSKVWVSSTHRSAPRVLPAAL